LTDQQRHFVETIDNSGEQLIQIVNDILDLSKIEAGQMDLHIAGFELVATVQAVIDGFFAPAQKKGLSLECQIDPDLPAVWRGDAARFRQILTNLVGNAVKFTEQGGILIHIERIQDSPDNALFKVTVCDTGIGIPVVAQQKIFDPFAQADGSMTRRYGGTGLGLAIVKRLVALMGGDIGIISTPGKGSTFWFTVCLEKQRMNEGSGGESKRLDQCTNLDVFISKGPGVNPSKVLASKAVAVAVNTATPVLLPESKTKVNVRLAPPAIIALLGLTRESRCRRRRGISAQRTTDESTDDKLLLDLGLVRPSLRQEQRHGCDLPDRATGYTWLQP
jgi:hypothetical protein